MACMSSGPIAQDGLDVAEEIDSGEGLEAAVEVASTIVSVESKLGVAASEQAAKKMENTNSRNKTFFTDHFLLCKMETV